MPSIAAAVGDCRVTLDQLGPKVGVYSAAARRRALAELYKVRGIVCV
jgi:hypothetical protein